MVRRGWVGVGVVVVGATVSAKHVDAFRSSIVRACWLRKLPMANLHAVLCLLDAPDGCDPAFFVIWEGGFVK